MVFAKGNHIFHFSSFILTQSSFIFHLSVTGVTGVTLFFVTLFLIIFSIMQKKA